MISLATHEVGLTYRLRKRLSLAAPDRRLSIGGKIGGERKANEVVALSNVSFSIKAGDRLGLIGPNGAGKTTLLKVLYGIYEPTCGTVDRSGRVDALFNINLGFRPGATGRRNIELRGLINGWSKERVAERMDEIIAFSRLGDFIDMPLSAYSQGMAARLAFATATSFRPEILLMDEWIGAGDRDFQVEANKRIDDMVTNAGIIVIASHSTSILRRICSHGIYLENGEARFFGPIEEALKFDEARHRTMAKLA